MALTLPLSTAGPPPRSLYNRRGRGCEAIRHPSLDLNYQVFQNPLC
uniref:Uncharacterized protein n=1 Tax=Anguilla anguilla TaxID=7936 RepID=A0A0E9WF74_ANGAN